MGLFTRREDPGKEERAGDLAGLALDLDETACPTCGRDLHPWQASCPDDGTPGVPRSELTRMPPPPAHLLDDDAP